MVRFELYRDVTGGFRWRLRAGNSEPVCWSESYTTKEAAINSINWVKSFALMAPIHDLT